MQSLRCPRLIVHNGPPVDVRQRNASQIREFCVAHRYLQCRDLDVETKRACLQTVASTLALLLDQHPTVKFFTNFSHLGQKKGWFCPQVEKS